MNFRRNFLLIWVVIAFIFTVLGLNRVLQQQAEQGGVSVADQGLLYCLPLDIDGDSKILLKDFANFAKNFNTECNPVGENKYESVSEFEIKNDPSALDITNYRGFELNANFSNYDLLAVSPGSKSGWLSAIGTCDSTNTSIYSQNKSICYAIASYTSSFASQETLGKIYLKNTTETNVIPSTVSLVFSDGQILSNDVQSLIVQPSTENSLDTDKFAIQIEANDKTNINGNAINLHLKFENANVLSFIPDGTSWPLTPLPCDTNTSGTMIINSSSFCASFAKTSNLDGSEIFGTVVVDPIDNKAPVKVTFGENAGYSEGTSFFPINGDFRTYSTPESIECGYLDIVAAGKPAGDPGDGLVNLSDFAAFVKLFKNDQTCRIEDVL
ncbi:hypothetical protein KC678_04570 [Candidatus Dojkabacteria bacterium]|uniref:Uncharacterized protein n=1 Tax=Candidatus Dojkabacteria bacterium TaxID=2099670 RepID=A0A955L255_9BACT|nr:hypothetical protein [Candidatus Dojkabacteria bacterium]